MTSNRCIPALVLAALMGAAGAADLRAQSAPADRNHLYDRFQLSGSLTGVRMGSKIRIDASNGTPGSDVSTDDLGLGDKSVEPRFALRWRLGRRHEIDASFLLARSNGSRVLADTIHIGDSTFAGGQQISSHFKSDQAGLTYRFAFRARDRSQIGVALGLGAILFDIGVDATVGGTTRGISKGVTAPTASLGLYGRWRSGSRWYIESDARALYFAVGRISAAVAEAGVSGRYFVLPGFGLEGAYGLTAVQVTLDPNSAGTGVAGKLRYSLQNLRLGFILVP